MQTDQIPTREAATLCGVSVKTFIRWKEAGKIEPVAKLPGLRGAYLFDRSDVETLVQS
jgi:predicted site-specific integrase-resolvase